MNHINFLIFNFFIVIVAGCENNAGSTDKESESAVYQEKGAITLSDTSLTFFENTVVLDQNRKEIVINRLIKFYKKNENKTRWLHHDKPTELFTSLLEVIDNAEDYGLYPSTYRINYLKNKAEALYNKGNPDQESLIKLDRDATASFMLFIIHLNRGRIVDPGHTEKPWFQYFKEEPSIGKLVKSDDKSDLSKLVDDLQPANHIYRNLREQLRKLNHSAPREIEKFSHINLDSFKIGYKDLKIAYIRNNLNEWGIETKVGLNKNEVDSTLIERIKDFQRAFRIKVDGLPGSNTLKYLNMRDEELKKLLALNLERLRWWPDELDKELILINVPEFMLRVYDGDNLQLEMKVVVGEEVHATPIFNDTLKYIEFGPTWTVPQSIIKEEVIPNLQENPEYYSDRDFKFYQNEEEIDPDTIDWFNVDIEEKYYKVVQQPGLNNALGSVKFIMPNSLAIYLHDTPEDHLFNAEERAFSHGCIRVENPDQFAKYLLQDESKWNLFEINKKMAEAEKEKVYLEKPYQVQISYLTAWVDDKGKLQIFDDIYDFDDSQLKKLEEMNETSKRVDNYLPTAANK